MRSLLSFRKYGVMLLVSLLVLSACHGGGGGRSAPLIVPTILTVNVPVSDTIVRTGFNAYSAAVAPGSLYKVSITSTTDDVDLNVYDTDNTFTQPIRCPIDNLAIPVTSPEDCILAPSGNTLYFGVDGTFLGGSTASYTIDVELLTPANRNPTIPFADQTTQVAAGVYSVPVTPGSYTVSITGLTDDADLHVFTDDGVTITPAICSASTASNAPLTGNAPEDCTLGVTAGQAIFFFVDGIFSSASPVSYTALVAQAPNVPNPISEGTFTVPVIVTAGTPTTGQVGPGSTSRYEVDNLSAGPRYTVSITGLTEAANLAVFTDSIFTTQALCAIDNTLFAGTLPESCTFTVPQGGSIFFTVSSGVTTGNGAAYLILVEPGP